MRVEEEEGKTESEGEGKRRIWSLGRRLELEAGIRSRQEE